MTGVWLHVWSQRAKVLDPHGVKDVVSTRNEPDLVMHPTVYAS